MAVNREAVKEEIAKQLQLERMYMDMFEENNEEGAPEKRSSRALMWDVFAEEVFNHIEGYTVPQYGDFPDDNVATWTPEQCVTQIEKYCKRFGSNARGEQETNLDLIKIAHYAQLAWAKRLGFEEEMKNMETLPAEEEQTEE